MDITTPVQQLHEEHMLKTLAEEAKQEVANGVSPELSAELDYLLNKGA